MMTKLADIPLGNVDTEAIIARRANREHNEQMAYLRLIEQYNATDTTRFTMSEVSHILRAEAELSMCNGCTGLPCRKSIMTHTKPTIANENGYITIRYAMCSYYRNNTRTISNRKQQSLSLIPAQYRDLHLRDYHIDENNIKAVQRAQSFINNSSIGVYYYGQCGCGKSMLAAIICNELIGKIQSIYMDVPAILDKLREGIRSENENIDKTMAQLSTVPLLVMDDIGAERTTEWSTERLYLIINNRNNNHLPTIYTSNYTLTELYRHYGENILSQRLTSRINASCSRIELRGGDRRVRPPVR